MKKNTRIICFCVLTAILIIIFSLWKGLTFFNDTASIILFSIFLLLSLTTLLIEHFFTKPNDSITASISILLLILPLGDYLKDIALVYNILKMYLLMILVFAIASQLFLDKDKPTEHRRNKTSYFLKTLVVYLGSGRIQYFLTSLVLLIAYVKVDEWIFAVLLVYSVIVINAILPFGPKIEKWIKERNAKVQKQEEVGTLFAMQSDSIAYTKLYKDSNLSIGDYVVFQHELENKRNGGIVVGLEILNEEKRAKILTICCVDDDSIPGNITKNAVYKSNDEIIDFDHENFVGIITESSKINRIRFCVLSNKDLEAGQLLQVKVNNRDVLYQLTEGITVEESIEKKNETSFQIGEAVQLGVWNSGNCMFEKYGWIPKSNTPVFKYRVAKTDYTVKPTEFEIGKIVGTELPIILDMDALTHHLAIMGVTGSGKSVFTYSLLDKIISLEDYKIICVDFMSEYFGYFGERAHMLQGYDNSVLRKRISEYEEEMAEFKNKRDYKLLERLEGNIKDIVKTELGTFIEKNEKNIAILEYPDFSNTVDSMSFMRWFFSVLFDLAKEKKDNKKILIVIEEAHTVIPEWSFIGGYDHKITGALVNSVGQIALRGRKHNIGLLVIAQRTANVSKTILTQCNSIIAFQQYDNTSKDFLSNYLGEDMVTMLSNLKQRQAIVVGKGFRSTTPVVFEVPNLRHIIDRIEELKDQKDNAEAESGISEEEAAYDIDPELRELLE